MAITWGSNPERIWIAKENLSCCPGCAFNLYKQQKNGWKDFYCGLNHNQRDGTRNAVNCKDYRKKVFKHGP